MKTILVADDHPIIRSGIKLLLKNHFGQNTAIHEAENGSQLIELSKLHKADMVIMDLNMPHTDPQSVVRTLLTRIPKLKILILTMSKEEIFGLLYLKLGAKGFVSKSSGEAEVLKAITTVMNGKTYMREDMKDFYTEHTHHSNPYEALTKRELEILRHLANGEAVGQIAKSYNLSMTAVSTHKANIFKKLQLNNLLELKSLIDIYPL